MTARAVLMMLTVCGLVWGGFTACLLFVMRREQEKTRRARSE